MTDQCTSGQQQRWLQNLQRHRENMQHVGCTFACCLGAVWCCIHCTGQEWNMGFVGVQHAPTVSLHWLAALCVLQ